jgi:hypothetical protein
MAGGYTGIAIDNSEMKCGSITLNSPTNTGLLMTNNSKIFMTGLFSITGVTTQIYGISINNSEMTTSNDITLNSPQKTGLLMTNNSILNISGEFNINTGTCVKSISITNSKMISGPINLLNISSGYGIEINNSKIISNEIIINIANDTGLRLLNNSLLINSTSFSITGTCQKGIYINESKMITNIVTLTTPTIEGLTISTNSILISMFIITINGSPTNGLLIDNSKIFANTITLNSPTTNGLLMTNNAILNNSGEFEITTGTCETSISITHSEMKSSKITLSNISTITGIKMENSKLTCAAQIVITNATNTGIELVKKSLLRNNIIVKVDNTCQKGIVIDNSKIISLAITIKNATTTGLSINNSGILINETQFEITGTCQKGIIIDNSKMTSSDIILTNPSDTGLTLINNGILNNSDVFGITAGNCTVAGISINNSEMTSGSIILTNTSAIGIQIDNSKMTCPTIQFATTTTGLQLLNNSILINLTSFTTTTCTTGISISNSLAKVNSINIGKSSDIGISMSNKSYLDVSSTILLNNVGEEKAPDTEYGILLKSNSTLRVSGIVRIVGLNTGADSSKNTNGLLIDDSYFCTKEALFVQKALFSISTYNSLGTGIIIQNNGTLLASKCVIENWGCSINMSNSLMKIDATDYTPSPLNGTSINSLVKNNNPLIILNNSKLYSIGKSNLISVVSKSDGLSNANTNCIINVYNKSYLYLKYFQIGDATPTWVTRTGIYINDSDVKIAASFTLVASRVHYSIVARNNSKLLMDTNISNFTNIYIGAQVSLKTLANVRTDISINDYTLTGSQNVCATIYDPSEETGFGLAIPP